MIHTTSNKATGIMCFKVAALITVLRLLFNLSLLVCFQHASRKGISKSLFSATKRWFGGNKPTGQVAANQNTTVV